MKTGAFTAQAKRAGMGVQEFATEVLNNKEDYTQKTIKRAQFARNMKSDKMAQGGKTQGYNDQLDESMGVRLGRESRYEQTLKDRRDESKAANKMLGRRAYSSVEGMDKGDRMMMKHGGVHEFAHGGKTQGYNDRDDESIGMRNRGLKYQSLKDRRDESAGMEKSMDRRKYSDVSTMDEDDRMMARGGSVEGKIDRDRFVKLRREKDKEIKKLKKEKGALRKETLKQADKDCDTEVNEARKDFDKEVKELKKDIGKKVSQSVAKSRKDAKEDLELFEKEYDELENEKSRLEEEVRELKKGGKTSKRENNEVLLLGGIAGILFGAFFNR